MEENKNEVLQEVVKNEPVEETTENKVEEKPVVENKKDESNVTKVSVPSFGKTEPEVSAKIDLSKPLNQEENETKEDNVDDSGVVAEPKDAEPAPEQEEVQPKTEAQKEEELDEKVEEVAEAAEEAIKESMETGSPLPENIQKLVDFMDETGGSIEEYVTLNKDYSDVDDSVLLREYYKSTKPHLSDEEIVFLLDDQFSIDNEYGDEKENKRKKLALKEQVAEARNHLDGLKSKYYEEIKAGSNLSKDQKEAVDFFDRYNNDAKVNQELVKKQQTIFKEKTDSVFNQSFEGFEYNVGDKTYRYAVKDVGGVRQTQDDISNFIGKFLDENNNLKDAVGYHKSLFTAMNADEIAKHFYNQGKADALTDSIKSSKNIDMQPRQTHEAAKDNSGLKFRAMEPENNRTFRIKSKK